MRSHAKAPKILVALSVTDKMPVGTLMKEFTTNFPYLGLKLYRCEANKLYRVPVDQPLAAVRADDTTDNSETVEPTIIIRGGMTIGQIERIFKEISHWLRSFETVRRALKNSSKMKKLLNGGSIVSA